MLSDYLRGWHTDYQTVQVWLSQKIYSAVLWGVEAAAFSAFSGCQAGWGAGSQHLGRGQESVVCVPSAACTNPSSRKL